MLQEDFEQELPEEANTYLEKVVDSAVRLDLLHKELYYFSKSILAKLEPQEISLSTLIQNIAENIGYDKLKIEGSAKIHSSEFLLQEIITELIQNVKIHAGQTAKINVMLSQKDSLVSMLFQDNGIGLSSEVSEKDLFTAANASPSNPKCYGLYFLKRICEMLGGHINYDESYKDGFRISVEL